MKILRIGRVYRGRIVMRTEWAFHSPHSSMGQILDAIRWDWP